MGVSLGKFAEKKDKKMKKSFFGFRKIACVLVKTDQTLSSSNKERNLKIIDNMHSNGIVKNSSSHQDNSVTPFLKWNYEDEYKSFVQNSMKRKHQSTPCQRKLRKIFQEQSDLHYSFACHVPINILNTTSNTLNQDLSGSYNKVLMNGVVGLDRSFEISPDSGIQIDQNKSLNIRNTKANIRNHSRSNSTNKVNNKQLKNLQLMQLTSEPRVFLDQTIVFEYLKAKRIIDKIMRPQTKKK